MALLDDVKLNLRISANVYDAEIITLIAACKIDLKNAGVENVDESDALINRAIITYAKAYFGFEEKADRYEKVYEHLKNALALSSDYNTR